MQKKQKAPSHRLLPPRGAIFRGMPRTCLSMGTKTLLKCQKTDQGQRLERMYYPTRRARPLPKGQTAHGWTTSVALPPSHGLTRSRTQGQRVAQRKGKQRTVSQAPPSRAMLHSRSSSNSPREVVPYCGLCTHSAYTSPPCAASLSLAAAATTTAEDPRSFVHSASERRKLARFCAVRA
ncbi:unnamed protein product, partial [Ectocarpus fasciculatus]